jgi:hypothetical protein
MQFFFLFAAIILRVAPYIPALGFIPYAPNFMPVAAIALFGSVYLDKRYALGLPILIMLVSDYFIGFYNPWVMFSVYGSFFVIGLFGLLVRRKKTVLNIALATVGGAILFYLATNFAVWAIPNSLYPHTLQGLLNSYIMGLPFLRNSLAGDIFYVSIMFGLYELIIYVNQRRRAACPVKSRN